MVAHCSQIRDRQIVRWTLREKQIAKSKRLNINGAINLEQLEPVVRYDDTIDADSTINLPQQLEELHLAATWIYVICDNARYYRSKKVAAYLETSRIKLVFLRLTPRTSISSSDFGTSSKNRFCITTTLRR